MNVLQTLYEHGLQAEVEGDSLVVFPRDRLTDDLRAYIRQHKPEIIEALQVPANDPPVFVYHFRVDGKLVTTHSNEYPDNFLQSMFDRFGNDRRITVLESWPIRN
jgi:TubC N-terminal docking domain